MFIKEAKGKIIKDSRGEKTIQISLTTYTGKFICSSPSGKSTGKYEVSCYNKDGIKKSLLLLNEFCDTLINKNFLIRVVDDLMQVQVLIDKFEKNYGKLGGNVTYVIHGVFLKAAAQEKQKEVWEFIFDDVNKGKTPVMPMPVGNCIGGGLHSQHVKMRRPDFQEFLLIPNEEKFSRAITKNIQAYESARTLLRTKAKNDESAWRTNKPNEEVLLILMQIAEKYKLRIGIDVAASTFFNGKFYDYKNKNLDRDRSEQIDYMSRLIQKYDLFYLEDPLQEEDFLGFKEILESTQKTKPITAIEEKTQPETKPELIRSRNTLIVGDDLITTNVQRLTQAIALKSINSVIIKPNQIGSILEVKKVVEICKKKNIKMIFSHRSGETMDTLISDLAVGFQAEFIKCGIMGRERLIKHKRLMDIEQTLK